MVKENEVVKFRNVSLPLKVAVVSAWIVGGLYLLTFLIGFFIGVMEI